MVIPHFKKDPPDENQGDRFAVVLLWAYRGITPMITAKSMQRMEKIHT